MKNNLSRYEKETIICYNEEETNCTIYTSSQITMRKLDKLCTDFPDNYKIRSTDADIKTSNATFKTYIAPKSFIKYKRPRQLTEEKKEELRQRMKIARTKSKWNKANKNKKKNVAYLWQGGNNE